MERIEKGKTLFIVNPISGNGKKQKAVAAIEKYYGSSDYSIVYTRYAGHARELARDTDATMVVAVGGDGTVSEVAGGIADSGNPSKVLGIIPCGSGDGLALHLGISRNPRKAVLSLRGADILPMDYATITDGTTEGFFFCTAGVGFDADVAEAFSKSGHRGLLTYISSALRLWARFSPLTYKITVDGKEMEGEAAMITVGNAGQWGNNARITPLASVHDGLLDVSFVRPFSTLRIPSLAFRLMTGTAWKAREVVSLRGRHITIERAATGAAHYDGDPRSMGRKIEMSVCRGGIEVAVPHGVENT